MSELKAFTFGLGQYTEDGSPCVVAFDGEKNPRLAFDEKFYLKSEADKVIAEKDKDIQRLEKLCESYRIDCDNLAISDEQAKRAARTLLKNMNHQKYKRCLALAKIASDNWHIHNSFYAMGKMDFEQKKCERYERHRLKWLAIADKFKEAK